MQQLEETFANRQPLHIVPEIIQPESQDPVQTQDAGELRSFIGNLKQKIEDLIAQIYELTVEKERDHSEHEVILQKLRDDHNHFSSEIQHYQSDMLSMQETFNTEKERFEQEKEKERKNMESARLTDLLDLQRKTQQLNLIYQEQQKYQLLEKDYKQQIRTLRQIYTDAQYKHHDAMNNEERKQLRQNQTIRETNQAVKKDTLRNAHVDAEKDVVREQKQAMTRNLQLKQKLLQYSKQLQRLKKQRQIITKRNRQAKVNASINLEGLEQYKAVGALQIAKIKSYKQKVETMKSMIAEDIAGKSKVIQQAKDKNQAKLKDLSQRLSEAKTEYHQKCKNVANMKALAETILEQRAIIEQFFLEALQYVGQQARNQPKDNSIVGNKNYRQKVDISELDMADKQKILRTLFTRVSMGTKKDLS